MREEHQLQLDNAVERIVARRPDRFYFVACGGSQAVLMPAQYILDRETSVPAHVYTANEFNYAPPAGLGDRSVVVTISHSGNTPETVAATRMAREAGALTVSLTNLKDSELWRATECPIHYDWGQEKDTADLNRALVQTLAFSVLLGMTGDAKWGRCLEELSGVDGHVRRLRESFAPEAKAWARAHKRDQIVYTVGSGINWGEVYSTSACWFMEMQWLPSVAINSGEYFHGPFEITDFDVPFVLVKSAGPTRFLDQRVQDFAEKFTERLTVLDQDELGLEGVDECAREYLAAILTGVQIRMMVEALAFERGHALSTRRYMWQMSY